MRKTVMRFVFLIPLLLLARPGQAQKYPTCESHLNCPPGLAQLQGPSSVCTAFLIDSDLVATNLHCLPADIQRAGSDCNAFRLVFVKTPGGENIVRNCKYVEKSSAKMHSTLAPDVALLRLDKPVNINPLKTASPNSGFRHQQVATIYKINPSTESSPDPVVEKITCTAIQNSIINPYFDSLTSAVFSFYPCKVIPGNSGSPVFNDNNEVVAVINSRSQLNLKDKLPYLAHLSQDASFATHVRCLREPNSCVANYTDEEAANRYKKIEAELFKQLEEKFKKDTRETEKELFKKSGNLVKWILVEKKISSDEKSTGLLAKYEFQPSCFNIDYNSIQQSQNKLSKNPYRKEYDVYEIQVFMRFNEQLVLGTDIVKKPGKSFLTMIPADLSKQSLPVSFSGGGNTKQELKLGLCN